MNIEEIKRLCPEFAELMEIEAKATKGPWIPLPSDCKKWVQIDAGKIELAINHDNDAIFVAACRAQVSGLIQALAEARQVLDQVAIHYDDAYCGQDLRDLAQIAKAALPITPQKEIEE